MLKFVQRMFTEPQAVSVDVWVQYKPFIITAVVAFVLGASVF